MPRAGRLLRMATRLRSTLVVITRTWGFVEGFLVQDLQTLFSRPERVCACVCV